MERPRVEDKHPKRKRGQRPERRESGTPERGPETRREALIEI